MTAHRKKSYAEMTWNEDGVLIVKTGRVLIVKTGRSTFSGYRQKIFPEFRAGARAADNSDTGLADTVNAVSFSGTELFLFFPASYLIRQIHAIKLPYVIQERCYE
ncbi:MAG: hypothetical protein CSA76_04435 [Spirochaetales bacterium]|nr:MAG: hypothetical protein CSA76_04435 [Spirochaetales bacterium]